MIAINNFIQNSKNISDEEINNKYKKGEIRIVTEQARYPLGSIINMLNETVMPKNRKRYEINPEYQRRKRWDNIKKSRLIESLIMNVPIPPIFLYEIDYSIYEVMDGQQRLSTIYDFYKGKFALEGLEYWKELNGRNYNNLPEEIKKGIDRRYLSSIILLQETAQSEEDAEALKKIVFERLNSGGAKLTSQEIRNALYNGKFNQLCLKLAKNDLFRKMWKLPLESEGEEELLKNEAYKKMEDVELVLRFFAYKDNNINDIKYPLEKFLDSYLKEANNYSEEKIKRYESIFNETITLIYSIFQESAFLLPKRNKNSRRSIGKIIYDAMMQVFSNYILYKDVLINNSSSIEEQLYSNKTLLYFEDQQDKYIFDTRYPFGDYLKARIEYFDKFLQSYINQN